MSLEAPGASPDVPTFRPYFDGAVGYRSPHRRSGRGADSTGVQHALTERELQVPRLVVDVHPRLLPERRVARAGVVLHLSSSLDTP